MPLIQRNLFPSRPPLKKNDGPSMFRQASNNQNQQNGSNVITNPNLSLYSKFQQNNKSSSDSSTNGGGGGKLFTKKNQQDNQKDAAKMKKLKKSQSASMISLLAINNHQTTQNNQQTGRKQNNSKYNYDSQDSFNSSDASSSDPNSLCSSSSSVENHHNNNTINGNNNAISRRRILSRSRDALNTTSTSDDYSSTGFNPAHDEDVWFSKSKLISDHVDEIITKWNQIDDEIWAKVICMERNRRVAKAYARTPILTINGYDAGFDGHRIGLNGFHNPMRDRKTAEIKNKIEDGIKIRMDDNGSLLVKRISDVDVFLISFDKLDTFTSEKIEPRKSIVLFDMKQYQNDLVKEMKSPTPNPRALERKCFCFISFATIADELLNTPVWCIIINLVALEMLVKLLPNRMSAEDNFYSLPISLSIKPNGFGYLTSPLPPKLPPRDLHNKKPPLTLPEPDYEEDDDDMIDQHVIPSYKQNISLSYDDPYYHGLSAHVPKFAHNGRPVVSSSTLLPLTPNQPRTPNTMMNPPIVRKAMNRQQQQAFWHHHHHPPSNPNFQPFTSLQHDAGYYRAYPPLPPPPPSNGTPNANYVTRTTGSSTFDPMSLIPSMPASMRPPPLPPFNNTSCSINDNNEIYGVNPTLFKKNTQFGIFGQKNQNNSSSTNNTNTSNSNNSSSALKNIFSRKKSSNKDHNNNTSNNNGPRM